MVVIVYLEEGKCSTLYGMSLLPGIIRPLYVHGSLWPRSSLGRWHAWLGVRAAHGMNIRDSASVTGSNRSEKGPSTTVRANGVFTHLPFQKFAVTVVRRDG